MALNPLNPHFNPHFSLTLCSFLVVYLSAGYTLSTAFSTHDGFNWEMKVLTVFNYLNILIAYWEISLSLHLPLVMSQYSHLLSLPDSPLTIILDLLFTSTYLSPPSSIFSTLTWARIWSTYALYDPSYADGKSFGYMIDLGNGWSTIPTCVLYLLIGAGVVGGDWTEVQVRAAGVVGLLSYYQMFYGTILYMVSYYKNGRYRGKNWKEVAGFVGISNGLWIVGPSVGMSLGWRIVRDGDLKALYVF